MLSSAISMESSHQEK
ncbi:hypothetical protein EYZ11_009559 [Aspergillus tanneri]|uniref:Uncharacterized protein n=1 Tax=Aspergillus tanneri TaxID=1220188 RepID=A0A4S3J7K8_9EURO|nr:hypothetical protein EYZ11_009559 [Aspergillus tanneri]